ncbi:hypothetical protein CLV62_12051 [Dysgonomonas alginatilytica]|uniref:Uncharacterized protein n=1 Tax=Dysgonomonas alginatilytica TaxID=1605892 RepID=A0A2V3PNA9_9BACT|nr:hypothetical protein [Dysgonomonas alginatilytica]PXV62363.1 hypothetical protein CLV62_12051 [Dysgonomonas alginatilytica]
MPTFIHDHLTYCVEKPDLLKLSADQTINLDNVEISDGEGNNYSYIDLSLKKAKEEGEPAKRDIWVGIRGENRNNRLKKRKFWEGERKPDKVKYLYSLELECVDVSRNGLIQYKYKIPEKFDFVNKKHPFISSTDLSLTHALYHAIKEFFHEHKFHKDHKDSLINPCPSSTKPHSIKAPDNPALLHYLAEFETILLESIHDINRASNRITRLRKVKDGQGFKKAIDVSNTLLEQCVKMLGFGVYYTSLCSSRYNCAFKKEYAGNVRHISPVNTIKKKEYYQCAINIENALNYIKVVETQYRDFINIGNAYLLRLNDDYMSHIQEQTLKNISDISVLQQKSENSSKQTNLNSIVIALISIAITLYGVLLAPDKKDIERIFHGHFQKSDSVTNMKINNENTILLDSIRHLFPKEETSKGISGTKEKIPTKPKRL